MDGRFDELLLGLAQKHQGIEALWYTLMSFYERRTDLFHIKETADDPKGFKPGGAEDMLRKQFNHFQARYLERAQPHLLASNYKALEGRGRGAAGGYTGGSAASGAAASAAAPPSSVPRALPAPGASAAGPSSQQPADAAAGAAAPIPNGVGASPLEGGDPGQWLRKEEHTGDNIMWNQSPSEVNLEIAVEKCTKHDIKVDIAPRKVCVKRKGEVLLEGRLKDKVNTEESTWHLSDGKAVVLSLEKIRPLFWESLFETPEAAS